MAKMERNLAMHGARGTLGGFVFRQMRDGSTRISVVPNFRNRKFSKEQKNHQSRFKEAAAYARDASKTKPIYAELSKGTTKNAYNIALSDWFNPPVIHRIERRDGRIYIEATDNVMVTNVRVKISDAQGKVLEEGDALQKDERWWQYASDASGKILAQVWDLAGNKTELIL